MEDVLNLPLVASIVAVVIGVLAFLSGLSLFLGKIKDLTKTDVDNKVFAGLQLVIPPLQKVVDFLSANVPHKKPVENVVVVVEVKPEAPLLS